MTIFTSSSASSNVAMRSSCINRGEIDRQTRELPEATLDVLPGLDAGEAVSPSFRLHGNHELALRAVDADMDFVNLAYVPDRRRVLKRKGDDAGKMSISRL